MSPSKTPSQRVRIFNLLKDGEWHTMSELHAIGWRYVSRVDEIRSMIAPKYEVASKRNPARKREWLYRMQPTGHSLDEPVNKPKKRTVEETVAMVEEVFGKEVPIQDTDGYKKWRQTMIDMGART